MCILCVCGVSVCVCVCYGARGGDRGQARADIVCLDNGKYLSWCVCMCACVRVCSM